MATTEQKKKLLKAKIAVALHDELGRVPKKEEIDRVFLLSRVMYKAVWGFIIKGSSRRKMVSWQSSNLSISSQDTNKLRGADDFYLFDVLYLLQNLISRH